MSTVDAGPATRTAVTVCPNNPGPGNAGIEAHIGGASGVPSLGPASAPIIDSSIALTGVNGTSVSAINTTVGSSLIVNPA